MLVDWLRKAPTPVIVAVIIVGGVLGLGVLGVYVLLMLNGVDTTDFRQWVQTFGITILLPLVGVNTISGVVAARSASNAEDNTNGNLTALTADVKRLNALLLAKEQGYKKGGPV